MLYTKYTPNRSSVVYIVDIDETTPVLLSSLEECTAATAKKLLWISGNNAADELDEHVSSI